MKAARNIIIIFLSIAAIILGNFIGKHYFGEPLNSPQSDSLSAILASQDSSPLPPRTKETGCEIQGSLSDPACTPGVVFPNASPAEICIPGYTQTVRNVPVSLKKKVYAEYAISYPKPSGSYELDHLIPLELGGANDIGNLFPEAASPIPGFHEKDLVENFLHNEVCAGRVSLAAAQRQIASDWLVVWNALTPEQIKYLRNQF
jgi:hypothetical protein